MVTDVNREFDTGPLSWVQSEIDQSLARSLESLALFGQSIKTQPDGDQASLQRARAHFRQAAGAIQMVGLEALVAYTDEIEFHLEHLEPGRDAGHQAAVVAGAGQACRKLRIFLSELVRGAPLVPLSLFPEYEALQRLRGIKTSNPTDLFFPDLSPRVPDTGPRQDVAPAQMAHFLISERRTYQQGLLAWLRGDVHGADMMGKAADNIEGATPQQAVRTFWWTVNALFDAVRADAVDNSFALKQLLARVDLQIRRLIDGSGSVAERLRRETLYLLAISPPVSEKVRQVQALYRLAAWLPASSEGAADTLHAYRAMREIQSMVLEAKNLWLRLIAGQIDQFPKLRESLLGLRNKAADSTYPETQSLFDALLKGCDVLPVQGIAETIAMEYATALLFAEDVFAEGGNPIDGLAPQVQSMRGRIETALSGQPLPALDLPKLVELSQRAQNRLLLAQVAQDIQANLRHMEQELDNFFRDTSKRDGLATLAKDGREISGALRILGLDTADALLSACMQQIAGYTAPNSTLLHEDFELLAESLSALGFYIEALEQQRPQSEDLIVPLLKRQQQRMGGDPAEAVALPPAAVHETSVFSAREAEKKSEQESKVLDAQIEAALAAFDPGILAEDDLSAEPESAALGSMSLPGHEALSIEATLEHDIAALQALGQQLRQMPADVTLQQQAQKKVLMLADDAKLVGNASLLDKLKPIRQKIEEGAFNQLPSLLSALTEAPQIEAPSAEAQRLLKVDATQLDAELLDIYLQEAIEVLDTVCEHRGILAGNPRDQEALRTVRRGFHTLKGSGRMVGLTELGDLAYEVEKIHNRLLENGHIATPAVLSLIDVAASDFRAWVETLMATKAVTPNPARLYAAIDAVDKELNPAAEIGLSAPSSLVEAATAPPEDAFIQALAAFEGTQAVSVVEPPEAQDVAPQKKTVPVRSEADLSAWADWTSVSLPTAGVRRDEAIVSPPPMQSHQTHEAAFTKAAEYIAPPPLLQQEQSAPEAGVSAKPDGAAEAAVAESVVADALPTESDSVSVGEVVLSKVLYGLFTEEAEQHWAVLSHELALMQIDPHHMLSLAMMRAAHTLAGIHLTAGFPRVAKVAKTLELMLIAISGREHEKNNLVSSRAVPVVARAVAGLRTLIDRIHAKEAFAPAELREAEAIEAEISALHQQIADGQFLDAESVELREAQRQSESEEAMLVSAKRVEENARSTEGAKAGSATPTLSKELLALLSTGSSVAPAQKQGNVADALLAVHDEVDVQLLPLFLEEGSDLYKQAGTLLRSLIKQPADQETQLKLKRNLHTFKGSARMAGAMRLGELAHQMETRLEAMPVEPSQEGLNAAYADALETDLDHLGYLLDRLKAGDVDAVLPWLSEEAPAESAQEDAPSQGLSSSVPAQAVSQAAVLKAAPAAAVARSMAQTLPALPKVEDGQLRVSASQIDRLVNEAGEIIITRTRAEGELRSLKGDLLELTNSVVRLRNHVRVIEIEAESQIQAQLEQMQDLRGDFDPLEFDRYTRLQELTRSIAEGVNDVSTVQQSMLVYLDSVNAALLSQARLSRDVQQSLFSVRTVPFSSVSDRLYRILRSLSKELHKRANLEIQGGQSGLDRAVLEKLVGPLEHLLRNALDHGVEAPEVRRAANKAETADITIAVRQAGNEIVIEFADDGAGLDLRQLRQTALEKGLITGDETLSDENVLDLIFRPGFSTSKDVTQVSGRGMGMDIVRNEVVSLGGRIDVSSVLGQGTRFALYLPLTVAVAQTVLIRGVEGRIWAIPVAMVEQVEHVTESVLQDMYDRGDVERRGERYPFYYFDRLVDRGDTLPESKRYNAILFLRTGQGRLVMHVDHMLGNQEVVIKNAGTQLARVPGLAGATILGDGQIVLIVNPIQLSQRAGVPAFTTTANVAGTGAFAQKPTAITPSVLIVDDSLTIRKVTSRLMTREGYTVETAKDGFEALQKVSEHRPDVILLDIEMPRMDGFEFAKMMKGDRLTRSIPIIMITSRTAEKHRARAKELEVDAYLGKPYQEEELLAHIKQLLVPTKH